MLQLLLGLPAHIHGAGEEVTCLCMPVDVVVKLLAAFTITRAGETRSRVGEIIAHHHTVWVVAVVPSNRVEFLALVSQKEDTCFVVAEGRMRLQ